MEQIRLMEYETVVVGWWWRWFLLDSKAKSSLISAFY